MLCFYNRTFGLSQIKRLLSFPKTLIFALENQSYNSMTLRDIKKDIQYVIGAFIDDCTLFLNMNPDSKNADEITGLIDKAVDLYNDLRDKVVSAPKEEVKAYFKGVSQELLAKTDSLYEELAAAVKKGLAA